MESEEGMERLRTLFQGVRILAIFLVIIITVTLLLSVGRVGVGYVAVVVNPVGGTLTTRGDGTTARFFLKPPWASIVQVYTATDSIHMWTDIDPATGQATFGDFPAVPSLTSDGLGVEVDITVRWSLAPGKVLDLFKKFPALDWKDRAIVPIVRRVIRDTIVKFTAMETIEKREAVGVEFETALERELKREPSLVNATILGTLDLREVALPPTFVTAIEAKLAAEQLAIAAEFNKTKILVLANATAMAEIIEAQGTATAKIIIANATYESIKAIAGDSGMNMTQLTNLYLTLEALKDIAQTGRPIYLIVTGEAGTWILPIPPV